MRCGDAGLRQALWQRRPTWVVSGYQDIRASLVDPRLSADTIKAKICAVGVD